MTASTVAEDLKEEGVSFGERTGGGRYTLDKGIINKSVNGVSGLMLVVTRSLGGLEHWHHLTSYRRISPSLRKAESFSTTSFV